MVLIDELPVARARLEKRQKKSLRVLRGLPQYSEERAQDSDEDDGVDESAQTPFTARVTQRENSCEYEGEEFQNRQARLKWVCADRVPDVQALRGRVSRQKGKRLEKSVE